ncbi:hypothetical protein T492DRAFT_1094341 [Pavlovales sp. CCMP2436]|nr:hypothetical protein T492DRAFT_1094341 [Pavlovales sp. CCMP2436]
MSIVYLFLLCSTAVHAAVAARGVALRRVPRLSTLRTLVAVAPSSDTDSATTARLQHELELAQIKARTDTDLAQISADHRNQRDKARNDLAQIRNDLAQILADNQSAWRWFALQFGGYLALLFFVNSCLGREAVLTWLKLQWKDPAKAMGGFLVSILVPFWVWLDNKFSAVDKKFESVDKKFELVAKTLRTNSELVAKTLSAAAARIDSIAARLTDRTDSLVIRTDSLAKRIDDGAIEGRRSWFY